MLNNPDEIYRSLFLEETLSQYRLWSRLIIKHTNLLNVYYRITEALAVPTAGFSEGQPTFAKALRGSNSATN